jgi:hypothetical protein
VLPVVLALAIVPLEILDALIADIFAPFPVNQLAVTPSVAKSPEASRRTIVLAPLEEEAVVLALSRVPVVIAEALMAVRADPLPDIEVAVIAPAANAPPASRRTIVLEPLEELAVVKAFPMVPEVMLEALIFVSPEPEPDTFAVIVLAAKLPPESRETIEEAPLAEAAVVLALAMVPDEMLLALIALMPEPSPLNKEAVITLEPKLPEASRRTMVLALLDVLPVVRALDMVPLVMFEALMSVRPAALAVMLVKLPVVALTVVALTVVALTVVAVITLALNEPLASRKTMVDAPLAELAVVLAFGNVPRVILEALIAALAALVS